ncbi:MAG TPA: septal ring lytic transglycosylase RlpA family protein [Frankiaceae bacterium]|nr:septal ring lytic transglycosylase RlpA family protein [Frankiaceae bacterium]
MLTASSVPSTSVPSIASPSAASTSAASTSAASTSASDLQPEPDLNALQAGLDTARQQVEDATNAATAAAARAVSAEIARQQAQLDVDRARVALHDAVRRTLTDGPLTSMPDWVFSPDPESAGLLGEMRQRSVTRQVDQVGVLRDAVGRLDGATRLLATQRDEATRQAGAAVLAADHARRLLDDGTRTHAANDAIRAQLAERKRALDALNAALVRALARVQVRTDPTTSGSLPDAVNARPDGTRPDASATAQAAVLRVLEATPPGQLPPGYQPTGQVFDGESSWYGPGFIGSPTSSGVPYDPEQLTCAMLLVPLGTVVRVTTPSGATATLLVNDHGPYVGNRIMDVSMRANRILNLGLGQVHIEVLQPAG